MTSIRPTSRKGKILCQPVALLFALLTALSFGCSKKETPAPSVPSVTAANPLERQVVEWDIYSARLESPETVKLSAQVSGVIEQAPFEEGALVQKGQPLFIIDERPFKAQATSAEAMVARVRAQVAQTDARFRRIEQLKGTKAISGEDYDEAFAALKQARADLGVAEAALDVANLNLAWAKVPSPIRGRVSRKLVTVGNLISGGTAQATVLTVVTSVDPLYAYTNVPERSVLKYRELLAQRKAKGYESVLPCSMQLENENNFPHLGVIDFIDTRVDAATGTIQIRCVVPNGDASLIPGLFSRVRVPGSEPYMAVLIPESAIGTNQDTRFVMLLKDDGTVEQRPITIGALFGSLRVIKEGIKAEDKVVLTGIQQLRSGLKVNAQQVEVSDKDIAQLSRELAESVAAAGAATPIPVAQAAAVPVQPSPSIAPQSLPQKSTAPRSTNAPDSLALPAVTKASPSALATVGGTAR